MKNYSTYLAFLLLIFFSSCHKKEKKDNTSPQINISSPAANQVFNMFDTVTVTAHVSDETKLSSVVVSLNDLNNIGVQGDVSVGIQGTNFTFTVKYPLTQYHLASGFYNISIMANDGSNSHQSTQQIYINESPTIKTGYYVAGASQPKSIFKYDASLNPVAGTISLNTGFNGMAYGGYNHQLFVNGNLNQSYQAINVLTNSPDWSMPYTASGIPQYMGVYSDGKKPYLSYYNGYVVSYSGTGSTDKNYVNSSSNYYATCFSIGSTYNLGIYKEKFGAAADKIMSFGKNTGIGVNNYLLGFNAFAIFEHTPDEFYVMGNDVGNNAVYYLYAVSTNILSGPFSLPGGKMLSAVQIDSDYLVYSASNGNIYGYRYSNGSALSLASGTAQKLHYVPKIGELSAACNNTLYVYAVSGNYTLTQQTQKVFTDSITGFEIVTNK